MLKPKPFLFQSILRMLKISLLYKLYTLFRLDSSKHISTKSFIFLPSTLHWKVVVFDPLYISFNNKYTYKTLGTRHNICHLRPLFISTLSLCSSIATDYEVTNYKHDNNEQNPRSSLFQVFPPGFLRLLNVLIRDGTPLRQLPLYGEIFLLDVCRSLHRLDKVVDPLRTADILSGQT